jgi:hypothetical protein
MYNDNEINVLSNVYEAIKGLNKAQIRRILEWVTSKFELEKHPDLKAVEREGEPKFRQEPAPTPVEVVESSVKPLKKRRGRRPTKSKPVVEKPVPQPAAAPGITGFIKYDNFEDLLLFSKANTNTAKILLAAAYLQEKSNLKELGSYDISTLFKKIGEEVNQPSSAINNLMSKKPPLLLQTGTQGTGLKSRRKFRVTEEGLRIARNYINE